jgi:hypothetical protein
MNSSRKSLFSAPPVSSVGVVSAIGLSVILITGLAFLPVTRSSYAQTTSPEDMTATTTTEGQTTATVTGSQIFAIQNTSTSIPDPTPGHEQSHQAVIALPPREDGRLYTGTLTYTSSRPVEVVILQQFNQNQTTTGGGAGVSTAVPLLTPGQEEAITLIHEFEGDQFDNLNFAGSALAFHSRTNENFTVTYTIIGEVVEPTPIPQ